MHGHPHLVAVITAAAFFVLGVLLVIGAARDWNWLYAADDSYQNRWTLGQLSRYGGRTAARVVGLFGGLFLTFAGAYWLFQIGIVNRPGF